MEKIITKYYCDVCCKRFTKGNMFKQDLKEKLIRLLLGITLNTYYFKSYRDVHLCRLCLNSFEGWLKTRKPVGNMTSNAGGDKK